MRYSQTRVISGFSAAPRGMWIDRQDRLYTAGGSQASVFDTGGRLLRRWSTSKPASAIAASADGSVYVGEAGQIEVFHASGKLARSWHGEGRLGEVTAIGFFRDSVLAADAKDRSIGRYDKAFKLLNTIGKDNRTNGFLIPNGVLDFSVDGSGIVHAANPGKHRVEHYSVDGHLLGHIGRFDQLDPSGFPGCCNPTNVALGLSGRVYVTEKAGPRAKVLVSEGKLISVIATSVFDPNCKNMAIAVDSRGRVYVADTEKLQIFVFEPV